MIQLRNLREDNDLTQEQCAQIGGISKKSYERYENEIRPIPSDILIKYAKYYNISADYILGLAKEMKPLK